MLSYEHFNIPANLVNFEGFYETHGQVGGHQYVPCLILPITNQEQSYRLITKHCVDGDILAFVFAATLGASLMAGDEFPWMHAFPFRSPDTLSSPFWQAPHNVLLIREPPL
jgi:hypothetical protein